MKLLLERSRDVLFASCYNFDSIFLFCLSNAFIFLYLKKTLFLSVAEVFYLKAHMKLFDGAFKSILLLLLLILIKIKKKTFSNETIKLKIVTFYSYFIDWLILIKIHCLI